jgi:hypothetical protein
MPVLVPLAAIFERACKQPSTEQQAQLANSNARRRQPRVTLMVPLLCRGNSIAKPLHQLVPAKQWSGLHLTRAGHAQWVQLQPPSTIWAALQRSTTLPRCTGTHSHQTTYAAACCQDQTQSIQQARFMRPHQETGTPPNTSSSSATQNAADHTTRDNHGPAQLWS